MVTTNDTRKMWEIFKEYIFNESFNNTEIFREKKHVMMERAFSKELWTYITIIVICLLIYSFSNYIKIVLLALKLPGTKSNPIFGDVLYITNPKLLSDFIGPSHKIYGPFIRIWISFFPIFGVIEPHDLQTILSSKKHTDKIFFYKLLHNFLGNGLITSSGVKWSYHRKLLQSTFHLNILEKFVDTFADSSVRFLDRLNGAPRTINITQYVNDCVLDILNEAVLGIPVFKKTIEKEEESPFRQGKVVVPYRISRPWLLLESVYNFTKQASNELNQKKKLDVYTKKIIESRRELRQNGVKPERKCLIDYMIEMSENNKNFIQDDIINETCTFMLAGQDSVGAAIAFCLFLLAQNLDYQKQCYEELNSIFGDDDRNPTMTDLREMRYLEQCIKETLRLYPSVPLLARKITEDIHIGKHILPAGSNVLIAPYATHRIEHIYPNPEKYDPSRFDPENVEKRHPYAYIPFSAGPRNCIGHKFAILEMKTVISKILRNFKLTPVPGRTKIEPSFRITVRAKGGLWINLEPRNGNLEF